MINTVFKKHNMEEYPHLNMVNITLTNYYNIVCSDIIVKNNSTTSVNMRNKRNTEQPKKINKCIYNTNYFVW